MLCSCFNTLKLKNPSAFASPIVDSKTMELVDLFHYESKWRILICKECRAVPQTTISRHINQYHNPMRAWKPAAIKSCERAFEQLILVRDPEEIRKVVRPPPDAEPIPFLATFHDGICCLLCEGNETSYICRGRTAIKEHLQKEHGKPFGKAGRPIRGEAGGIEGLVCAALVRTPVTF